MQFYGKSFVFLVRMPLNLADYLTAMFESLF